jgi:cysteine sulfinate desulfinase/cysteine desulfurase-like protein
MVRTTIAIDDDVLMAARAIARQRNQSVGKIVSELARHSLRAPMAEAERNGIPLLPVREKGVIVTSEIVNALRDELP